MTTPVPYDPVVQTALEQYLADRPPLTAATIAEARQFNLANQPAVDLREGAVEASEHVAPGTIGHVNNAHRGIDEYPQAAIEKRDQQLAVVPGPVLL